MKNELGAIGLSYKSASVEIRQHVSFTDEEAEKFVLYLKNTTYFDGIIVLSTCNRVEIYFHLNGISFDKGVELLFNYLFKIKDLDASVREHFYILNGKKVVSHFFSVASGMQSIVLGEDQIVGQIKNAFTISERTHCAGAVLTRLCNSALNAGKKVRTDTHINEGYASVSSAAVALAKQKYEDIEIRSIFLIGAGQTGKLSMMSLVDKGCKELYITNRTRSKAEELASTFHATVVSFEDMKQYIAKCDMVMVATGSKTPLINKKMIEDVMQERTNKQLTIIDLSVPRNVTDDVREVENVTLYDVDDTEPIIAETIEKRKAEIVKAEAMLKILVEEYMDWLESLNLSPTIRQIKEQFRTIHKAEMKGYKKNPDIDIELVESYGEHIADKYSGLIIKNLKALTENGKNVQYLEMINQLFEIAVPNEK